MITESYIWKDRLYEHIINLSKLRLKENKQELTILLAQESLMIGAYIIRKLSESNKLPTKFLNKKSKIGYADKSVAIIDDLNRDNIGENYNLNNLSQVKHKKYSWKFILNQLIHSYSFGYILKDGKVISFFINSSRDRDKIFIVDIKLIFKIYLSVSEGDLTGVRYRREFWGNDENGEPIFGGMKYQDGTYQYPVNFDVDEIVKKIMDGNASRYDRTNKDWSNCNYTGDLLDLIN